MTPKGASNGTVLLAAVLGIVIGGVGGFYVRYWNERDSSPSRPAGAEAAGAMSGGGSRSGAPSAGAPAGGPMSGGMGGGMVMGGPGGGPPPGMALVRTVRNLATVQKVQNQGLTPQQAKALLPVLKALRDAEKVPQTDAEARTAEIEKLLTDGQKDALAALQPFRGGRGGGPAGGGSRAAAGAPAGAPSGPPTRPMAGALSEAGGGGGMMGGGDDPEKPFASERNKAALDELIVLVEQMAG